MSHEDTLLMIDAINAVARQCHIIALMLLLCTALKVAFDIKPK